VGLDSSSPFFVPGSLLARPPGRARNSRRFAMPLVPDCPGSGLACPGFVPDLSRTVPDCPGLSRICCGARGAVPDVWPTATRGLSRIAPNS
jgi:hypothetical protein